VARADGATVKAGSTAAKADGYTPETFAAEVLSRLGVPASAANMNFMTSWMSAEGGNWNNSASYNPLNTSQQMPGELGTMGSQGNIRRYANWEQGLQATVKTIQNGRYSGIVDALKHSDANGAVAALKASPWDVNHYSGGFPLGSGAAYAQANGATPDGQIDTAGGGGGVPSVNGNDLTAKGTSDVASFLDGQYGYLTAFLNNPDVGPIIKEAAKEGWNDNTMLQALSKTSWWQTTGQTARQWESTLDTDPATAKAQLATTQSHITALAKTSGIHLSSDDVYHMAYAANMFGWSDLQIQQAVGAQFKYKSGATYGGAAGTDVQAMKELAHNYMVPVSDKAIQQWVGDSLSGNRSMGDFEAYVKNMAKSLYAGNSVITSGIDAGQTTQTIMDPWRQVAAQTLDKAPAEIDFTDPKFMKAINQIDPKTGTMAPMSLEQWQTTLKTDKVYGYDHTDAAMNAASDLLTSFGQKMGTL
jgi:hypothetical protein